MNKKIKRMLKYGLITIVLTVIMIMSILLVSEKTVAATKNPTAAQWAVSGNQIGVNIVKAYSRIDSDYTAITRYPIDNKIFNSDSDFFCSQHGTQYAGVYRGTSLGNANGADYHEYHYNITKNAVGYGASTVNPKGDIDTSAWIYLNEKGETIFNGTLPKFIGFKQNGEAPEQTLYTNWVYTFENKTFGCESNGGHDIKDGGMAYLLAVYKQSDENRAKYKYESDPLQYALWSWKGQLKEGETNPLKYAAENFQAYHTASENPCVDTLPGSTDYNVGTTFDGNNYVVGPFTMSNYVRAQDYTYNYGSDSSVQSAFNRYNGSYQGTIIKAEAVVKNESGETKKIKFPVPSPGATYNINLSSSAIEGYDELVDIIFTYQRIHASGNGTMYIGHQKSVVFKEAAIVENGGCGTYYATCTRPGYNSVTVTSGTGGWHASESHTHVYYCGGCTCAGNHTIEGCTICKEYKTIKNKDGTTTEIPICKGNHTLPGCKCYCPGHYYYGCEAENEFKCKHGHTDCKKFTWCQNPDVGGDCAQDAFAGSGALTNEIIEYTVNVSVPLKTKMKLYKYITSVDHVGESVNTFSSTLRKNLTMAKKENETVKVERGDLVTYTLELVNDSRFPTRAKVKDTLPEECTLESCSDNGVIIGDWITVNAKSTVTITLKIRPTKSFGKDTNTLEFITTNTSDIHMQCTTWGSGVATHGGHTNTNIVNTYTQEKDSDTYEIKEYNVAIEKYISDVEHNPAVAGLTNAYNSTKDNNDSRYSKNEKEKESQPIYVEYGDTVTYKIKIYNTTDTYKNFDSRDKEPYWSPDKIYLNIEDTLPKKCTDVTITADNDNNGRFNISNGKFTYNNLKVPADGVTTITITLRVNEHIKDTIEVNNCEFVGTIKNINYSPNCNVDDTYCAVNNKSDKTLSSDWYKLNYYDSYMDKYIYMYDESMMDLNNTNGYTNETTISNSSNVLNQSRERLTDSNKKDNPVSVENGEIIKYYLKVTNDQTIDSGSYDNGVRPATQVRPTTIVDKMQKGLSYESAIGKIYRSDGTEKNIITETDLHKAILENDTYNQYTYTIDDKYILDPGEYLIIEVRVKVTESNMYLYDLYNTASTVTLTNINNTKDVSRPIKEDKIDENMSQETSTDYVRMKDLIISGQVWLDLDRNGIMNDSVSNYSSLSGFDSETLKNYYNINDNAMKKDIVVKLYQQKGDKSELVRTTLTDANGLFTFAKDENMNYYPTDYTYQRNTNSLSNNFNASTTYQKIDKATGKDSNGNYKEGSTYNNYYIEYEYDGVLYKSTEIYAGMENLTTNDGGYISNYLIDSNAKEFTNVREEFNEKYEYITNDLAYGYDSTSNLPNSVSNTLEFEKTNHTSQLLESNNRIIAARSFITEYNTKEILTALNRAMNYCGASSWKTCRNHWKDWQTLIALDIVDASKYSNNTEGRKEAQAELKRIQNEIKNNANASGYSEMTKLLWLYAFDPTIDNTIPKTDYLKHINLGLELREDVDITLTKDVYKVTTTLDGEEIEYDFNRNNGINDEMGNGTDNSYLKDYISNAPYGLEFYESDFKQRIEQYEAKEVRDYKGEESELNVEVTYRITVNNNATTDDDNVTTSNDTNLKVKVSEILDLYDTNFKQYVDGADNTLNVRQLDSTTGMYGEDRKVSYAEAWYFKEIETGEKVPNHLRYTISNVNYEADNEKPIYVSNINGNYKLVKLNVSQKSTKEGGGEYTTKVNNFEGDGYYTLYITGMDGEYIDEGQALDIYVKYVLDKDDTSTVEIDNEELKTDIVNTTGFNTTGTVSYNGYDYTYKIGTKAEESTITTSLKRTLKVAEKIVTDSKQKYGRGTENIAQINAYSVWYSDNKPASIVDKDSNAGNIGETNSTIKRSNGLRTTITRTKGANTSADYIEFYEDNVYKTGIELMAKNSENSVETVKNVMRYQDWFKGSLDKVIIPNRIIEGTVWNDSRSESLGTGGDTQYIGDGLYNLDASKIDAAKSNENVKSNYKDGSQTEDNDLLVRNAKAEFIEIVKVAENKYYEQVLKNVTWPAVQSTRTDTNGKYVLEGMTPGRYIVRFTYGDIENELTADKTIDSLSEVQKDNLIFNGQDYKSTQYNNTYLDEELDDDKILKELQNANKSDARDDEIRRLEVNAYSEVMTNYLAEILKGIANGKITKNSLIENNAEQLNELSKNTAMTAETVEFLVKPEKPDENSITYKTWFGILSIRTEQGLKDTSVDVLYKDLINMDYEDVLNRTYRISNIDFGIEYRPEAEIGLENEINEIKLITNNDEVLIDLFFKTEIDIRTSATGEEVRTKEHKIDLDKSKGYELVQFGSNDYQKLMVNNIDTEHFQGYVYIQIDPEVLQGSKVEISYKMTVQNFSEVDRIRDTLNNMRLKNNPAVEDYTGKNTNLVNEDGYTASETARNILYNDIYTEVTDKDAFNNPVNSVYRNRKKQLVNTNLDTTTNEVQASAYNGGYFGKFVGYAYYTGETNDTYKDVIAELKFNKILDYVDTDLEYESTVNGNNLENKYWAKETSSELDDYVLRVRKIKEAAGAVEDSTTVNLTDVSKIMYDNLVVSVSNRLVDSAKDSSGNYIIDSNAYGLSEVYNKDMDRFMTPAVVNEETSKGIVYLPVSKIVSSETDTDNMTYENIAEIIEYISLTGRRTNFATTIGNADISTVEVLDPNYELKGSEEFATASFEADTAATETITFTPPTGLMKNRKTIVNVVETTKTGVKVAIIGVAVVLIGLVGTNFAIRKYKKRRIK